MRLKNISQFYDDRKIHIPSGCGISGIINRKGESFSSEKIINSMCNMLERGNGLGSGYAGYGIYPEFKDKWCFHIMYQENRKDETEEFLKKNFKIVYSEEIPTKNIKSLKFVPFLWRYFLETKDNQIQEFEDENDFIVKSVMYINKNIENAFVFSSGKNMGIFKGVGEPDEIAEFYKLYQYKGYIWIGHNRFPTNTVGWWGGAHPFGILDWAVVHNGEISSYGINKRYLENYGYFCTLYTDTEVITYLFDLLHRKHKLKFEIIANIFAAPFWERIKRIKDHETQNFIKTLRIIYSSALINGPFAILVANSKYLIGLNDRIKLRPLLAGEKDEWLFIASEESAIRKICKNLNKVWMPDAGKPVIGEIKNG